MDDIIFNVASYKRKETLINTISSIYSLANIINVSLNDYDEIPHELIDSKINIFITDNSKGDAFKFINLNNSDGYFFTIDDDLIYSKDYVNLMIDGVEKYHRKKIVTLHGRYYNEFPIKSYYKSHSKFYHCLQKTINDNLVHIGGTGVMCFHTDTIKIPMNYFTKPNMADIWFSKFCYENNIAIICLEHNNNLLKHQNVTETIYNNNINNDQYQTKLVNDTFLNEKKISIIIPTYKNTSFIVECINSVINSCQGLDVEILIGIDSCNETLDYIKNKSFDNRIKFLFFEEKVGAYIIRNSLAKIANSDILLFFDSDDIMDINMISTIINGMKINDIIKPMYSDFSTKPNYNINRTNSFGEGVFGIKKELFLSMNGFEPWPVAADSDFMGRLYKNKKKVQYTNEVVFYRRIHPNSLTQSKETGMYSSLRGKYANLSKNKKNFSPLPKLVISDFYEVPINTYTNNNINSSSIPIIVKTPKVLPLKNRKSIDYEKINVVLTKKTPPKMEEKPKVVNKPPLRNDLFEKKMSPRTLLAKKSIKKR
jgi:glycosyltransferase involved in cell wall biosynthesis